MQTRTQRWAESNLKQIGRRWFLTGAGVTLTLPYLEALFASDAEAQAVAAVKRLFLFHMPAGVNGTAWAPVGTGTAFTLGPTMKSVDDAGLKPKVTVVTGTSAPGGPVGHTCGISGVLTGFRCVGNSTTNSVSFDQLAAKQFGPQTRFPSIQLGTAHNTENPNQEPGFSTVLKDNLNWADATTPLSREIVPLTAFNRIFAGMLPTTGPLTVKDSMRKSILDYSLAEGAALRSRLGTEDKVKLDQYLSGLRDLEAQIQTTTTVGPSTGVCMAGDAPPAKPADLPTTVKLMLDIVINAFKCDLTRVATFAYQHTTTEVRHDFLGVNVGYHTGVTHHANQPAALANYATVNSWLVSQCVYALQQLDKTAQGTGTMLDNAACMCFSELADGNTHSSSNIPVLLAGSAGGRLLTGRAVAGRGAIEQVHVALLQALGVSMSSIGRAMAPLPGLLA